MSFSGVAAHMGYLKRKGHDNFGMLHDSPAQGFGKTCETGGGLSDYWVLAKNDGLC